VNAPGIDRILAHARGATGFMPDDEGDALFEAALLAAGEGPEPLIEIGAYCGKSTLYIAAGVATAALRQHREPNVVFSLDHHRGSEENQAGWEHHDPGLVDEQTGLMDTLPAWRRTLQGAGAEKLVVALVGDSEVIAACWQTQLRFVFIDGGHGSDPAWADYRGWAPKVVSSGLLAIHDVFPDPADGGRPPYELYCRAIESGAFEERVTSSCGSLKILRRVGVGC
jgi:hypothetical protein